VVAADEQGMAVQAITPAQLIKSAPQVTPVGVNSTADVQMGILPVNLLLLGQNP
jgi:hypothetical protein